MNINPRTARFHGTPTSMSLANCCHLSPAIRCLWSPSHDDTALVSYDNEDAAVEYYFFEAASEVTNWETGVL